MKRSFRCTPLLMLLFGLQLTACASVSVPRASVQPSQGDSVQASPPKFSRPSNETKAFRLLAREQEGRLTACSQDRSCDRAHFTRALLYLSEDQRLAAKHFQEVVALSPKSPLASLSVSWLRLLRHQPTEKRQDAVFAETTQWLIHDLWSREQSLKQELNIRGRKLEELSAQLEALKQIDMEMDEKPNPLRPKSRLNQRTPEHN